MSILSNDDVYTIQSYKRSYVLVLVKTLKFAQPSANLYLAIGYSEIDKLLHPFDVWA